MVSWCCGSHFDRFFYEFDLLGAETVSRDDNVTALKSDPLSVTINGTAGDDDLSGTAADRSLSAGSLQSAEGTNEGFEGCAGR